MTQYYLTEREIKNLIMLAMAKAKNSPITPDHNGRNAVKAWAIDSIYNVTKSDSKFHIISYYYFLFPKEDLMKDRTYLAITKARGTPTKTNSGQRATPVSCTPDVTDASKSAGVVVPKKSIYDNLFN